MKHLKRLCAAFVLIFTLALSAFAGEIQIPLAPPLQATSAGRMDTGKTSEIQINSMGTVPVTEAALNLLMNMLSLI